MEYTKEQIDRDLNAHQAARMAAWLWGANYASSGLGLMGYWDRLSDSAKNTARRAVSEVLSARSESPNAGNQPPP